MLKMEKTNSTQTVFFMNVIQPNLAAPAELPLPDPTTDGRSKMDVPDTPEGPKAQTEN